MFWSTGAYVYVVHPAFGSEKKNISEEVQVDKVLVRTRYLNLRLLIGEILGKGRHCNDGESTENL